MRDRGIVVGCLIGLPIILYVSINFLLLGTLITTSFDDVYGQYRTGNAEIATINPYPMAFFYYRDEAGRCIDFWPMVNRSQALIAAGHGCSEWQRDKTWTATRNPDHSLTLENQDGEVISLHRMVVSGRWTRHGLRYDLPAPKSAG